MKLFIDTADVAEIREAASWGVLDGVTTNPSLVAKTGRDFETVLHEICALVDGPVSAEVVSTEAPGMVEEGARLSRIHRNIVVKCPMIPEGLKATRALTDRGIRVNVTLVSRSSAAPCGQVRRPRRSPGHACRRSPLRSQLGAPPLRRRLGRGERVRQRRARGFAPPLAAHAIERVHEGAVAGAERVQRV